MSDADQFREMIEAYALGALDPQDRADVETHLVLGCAECAKALEESRWLVSQLAYLAPEAQPSDLLRGRLLTTVRAEAAESGTSSLVRSAIPTWIWGAVAAALLFAFYNGWKARQEHATVVALQRQVAAQLQVQQLQQEELALAKRETVILSDPRSIKISMPASKKQLPPLEATWHAVLGIVVSGQSLPAPAGNRTLQLWLIPKDASGKPIPSLAIRPAADGKFHLLVQNPPDTQAETKALAITEEPEGGSQAPTTAPLWVGTVTGK